MATTIQRDGTEENGGGAGSGTRGGGWSQLQSGPLGWFFGDKTLKEELLAQVDAQAGAWHNREELRESAEAK